MDIVIGLYGFCFVFRVRRCSNTSRKIYFFFYDPYTETIYLFSRYTYVPIRFHRDYGRLVRISGVYSIKHLVASQSFFWVQSPRNVARPPGRVSPPGPATWSVMSVVLFFSKHPPPPPLEKRVCIYIRIFFLWQIIHLRGGRIYIGSVFLFLSVHGNYTLSAGNQTSRHGRPRKQS